jgi:hypothetical protein
MIECTGWSTMDRCIRQLHRPEHNLEIEGVGDCTICIHDEANKNCAMYFPITMEVMKVTHVKRRAVSNIRRD